MCVCLADSMPILSYGRKNNKQTPKNLNKTLRVRHTHTANKVFHRKTHTERKKELSEVQLYCAPGQFVIWISSIGHCSVPFTISNPFDFFHRRIIHLLLVNSRDWDLMKES